MPILEREGRNPYWLSGRITSAMFYSLYIFVPEFSPLRRVAKYFSNCHSHHGHPSFCILQLSKHLCTVVVILLLSTRCGRISAAVEHGGLYLDVYRFQ